MKSPTFLLLLILLLHPCKTASAIDYEDDDGDEVSKSKPAVLLAHTLLHSKDLSKPQKSVGLPQTISAKKVIRLLERSPLTYYAGTKRARMHVVSSDDSAFYVWYAWKGADLKADGYLIQVFQLQADAKPHEVVDALHQYGELDINIPFAAFDKKALWRFMFEFQKQKDAKQKHGLVGMHFYLTAWRGLHEERIVEEEISYAIQKARTLAEEPAGWFQGGARLRLLNSTDLDFDFIVIEEDSDLGNLYDTLFGRIYRAYSGDDSKSWGKEWARQAIYKFQSNTTIEDRKFALEAFPTGKQSSKNTVSRLFEVMGSEEKDGKLQGTDAKSIKLEDEDGTVEASGSSEEQSEEPNGENDEGEL